MTTQTSRGEEPRKRRERRSGQEQRRNILGAARAEFVKSGFAGTTMRDIAAAADVNDALLYRYFESKARLFDEAVFNPLDETVSHTFVSAAGEDYVKAVAERFFTEGIEAMREIFPLLTIVLADAERGERFYRDRLRPAINQMVDATKANLNVWEHQRFSPELVVRLAWGVCWIIALDERFSDTRADLEIVVPDVVDLIWNGLKTRVEDTRSA